ncbi:murein biosynthesis integral membrane protein MurJ [Geodermatophilus ruber]|uniref:murein biosynthesis integral membrane protein MurJ n=1 Tax=Geodermatophilus ruber TaxID=504800 RepID=UPI0015A707E0|nr:lipid II flippase MurJ [Geodermatophilus ruber]
MTIAGWTLVSRLTGFLRLAVIGAVLGPTLLGNTFQFANSLPNLVYYGFLAGSLFSSLLVPPLVTTLERGDRHAAARIAGGFLGVALSGLALAACAAVLVGPLLLRLSDVGLQAGTAGAAQERVARLLLLLLMPQVLLYALAGTAVAVMNARRRFALAAAAPALENVVLLVILGLTALLYGSIDPIDRVPGGKLVLLGCGATAAVGVHAAVQWWGARRAGVTVRPRAGWRDPEVRALARRAMPALGVAALAALQMLAVLLLANRVPGGVVAAEMGMTFYQVVVALGAAPVALALLPRLARLHADGNRRQFQDAFARGVALILFVSVPAAVGYVVLARPLAEVLSVGRMGSTAGVHLVATAIAAFAPAVVGQGLFHVLSYTCYARQDTRTPLRSMTVQTGVFVVLASGAFLVAPTNVLAVVGLSFSTATLVGAAHLGVRLRRDTGKVGGRLVPCLRRVAAGTVLMIPPAWAVAFLVPRWIDSRPGWLIAAVTAALVGAAVFLLVQAWWRAPELAWVIGSLGRARRRADVAGGDLG